MRVEETVLPTVHNLMHGAGVVMKRACEEFICKNRQRAILGLI